jgi:hypothetical protein
MGGLVFNTYRGMATVKAKHAPCQPRSQKQLLTRSICVNLARTWAANLNQAAWNAYAASHPYLDGMGLTIRATGLNWFIALNSRLNALLIGAVATPPVVAAPGPSVGLTPTPSAGSISLAWAGPTDADKRVEVWLDGPHSKGRQGSLTRARLKGQPEAAASPYVMTGLIPGRYSIWARTLSETDGQVSTWVTAQTDVT